MRIEEPKCLFTFHKPGGFACGRWAFRSLPRPAEGDVVAIGTTGCCRHCILKKLPPESASLWGLAQRRCWGCLTRQSRGWPLPWDIVKAPAEMRRGDSVRQGCPVVDIWWFLLVPLSCSGAKAQLV